MPSSCPVSSTLQVSRCCCFVSAFPCLPVCLPLSLPACLPACRHGPNSSSSRRKPHSKLTGWLAGWQPVVCSKTAAWLLKAASTTNSNSIRSIKTAHCGGRASRSETSSSLGLIYLLHTQAWPLSAHAYLSHSYFSSGPSALISYFHNLNCYCF